MGNDCHLTSSANEKHVTQVVEERYHLKLVRFDLNNTLHRVLSIVSLHHIIGL